MGKPSLFMAAALLVLAAALLGVGTLGRAQESDRTGRPDDDWAARAGRAAAALAAAHPEDRAVAYLAEMVERETAALSPTRQASLARHLQQFAAAAEGYLLGGEANSQQVQQLMRGLMRQVRQGEEPSAGPSASLAREAEDAPPAGPVHTFGRDLVVEENRTVESATALGGDVTVRGRVAGDAVAVGGDVRLEPGARVEGDAVSVGGRVTVAPEAWVAGERTQLGAGALSRTFPLAQAVATGRHGDGLAWISRTVQKVGMGLVLALVSLVIATLAPSRTRRVIATVRRRPGWSLASGVLALVVTLMASVVLVVTIVGIPLVPVLFLAVALAVVLGLTGVACLVGETMPGRRRHERTAVRCILIGVGVLTLLSVLPLGGLFVWLVVLAGLGSVILSRLGATAPLE